MIRLLFVVLMMTCSVSWAKWEVTASDGEITFYHDKSTMRRNGTITKMWVMQSYSVIQTNHEGKNYKSGKVLYAYDCASETLAGTSLVTYSGSMGKGNVISSITGEESWLSWEPIVPNSIGEVQWKIACSKQ